MNELSLFSGAGGGLLASKYLLGWRTIGYVEWEDYSQRVLAQRIKDGFLDKAPIFGDIRTFISEGYARRYRGVVDVVSAGFPCQPFSVAGKQKGSSDERNMWPPTKEVIRIVKPEKALLENVPGLLSAKESRCPKCDAQTEFRTIETNIENVPGFMFCPSCEREVDEITARLVFYFGRILRDLSSIGYNARWQTLSASETGACHKRDRLWIMAYSGSSRTRMEKH